MSSIKKGNYCKKQDDQKRVSLAVSAGLKALMNILGTKAYLFVVWLDVATSTFGVKRAKNITAVVCVCDVCNLEI